MPWRICGPLLREGFTYEYGGWLGLLSTRAVSNGIHTCLITACPSPARGGKGKGLFLGKGLDGLAGLNSWWVLRRP